MLTEKTHIISEKFIFAGSPSSIQNLPKWLPKANYSREQNNLIAKSNSESETLVFVDFFSNYEYPSLITENGLFLSGKLLSALAGLASPGKYAQTSSLETLSIGEVSSVTGLVSATRIDGTTVELNQGDPVFQGDTIETSGDGNVGLTFIDKTTFSLSDGGKMVLDELIFDPTTGSGTMVVDMVEGAFSFISGEVAKTGPDAMTLKTPVVTMGIRGTTVAGKAAVEGNDNSFTLLQDADGGVGQISVSNSAGTQVLSQVGATTVVSSFQTAPPAPIILSAAQIQANYGTVLNVLPPTPAVAPQPQSVPEAQQEQEESQEQVSEEESLDEENSDEAVEDSSSDDDGGADEEEGSLEEEGLDEGEDDLLEGDEVADGEAPINEDGPLGEESAPPTEEDSPSDEDTVARESFDQALADGATPEEAMAQAAEAAGFDGPPPEQLDGPAGGLGDFGPEGGPENIGPADAGGPDPFGDSFAPPGSLGSDQFGGSVGFGSDPFGAPGGSVGFGSDPFGGPGGPGGFGPDPFGGPGGPGGFGPDPFGGPGGLGGFGPDPFGGPGEPLGLSMFGFVDPVLDYGGEEFIEQFYFFDDPALYDDFIPPEELFEDSASSSSNQTLFGDANANTLIGGIGNDRIDGGLGVDTLTGGEGVDTFILSDFGDTITDFSSSDKIEIVFSFDPPSPTYNVTRSSFYSFESSSLLSSLTWRSEPSTSSQNIVETESNGSFGSAQVLSRASFKISSNNEVGNDAYPWVNVNSGYIAHGVDIFKVDLQEGETLVVDVDYGDSFSRTFDSFVTIYNSSFTNVAENDNSLVSQGGTGSSGSLDSYLEYTSTTTESFYIFFEDAPQNSNSSTVGDYELNLSIIPTAKSTGLGTSSTSVVGGNNELPYIINITENTSNYLSKSFKSGLISSIRRTDSTTGDGSEIFIVAGDGTNSAIWMWDDLSQGYGISDNELTFVAHLENFDNDTLNSSQISFTA